MFWVPKPAITKALKKKFKPSTTDIKPFWSFQYSTGNTGSTKAKESYVSTIIPFRGMRYIKRILDSIRNKKAYICGGYARYILSSNKNPAKAKDIDIFFVDSTTLAEVQAELEHKGWMEIRQSEFAITLQRAYFHYPIQLIKPVEGLDTVQAILDNFDFTICAAAIWAVEDKLHTLAFNTFAYDEVIKKLHLVRPENTSKLNPLDYLKRIERYVSKGYSCSSAVYIKLLEIWRNYPEVEREKIVVRILGSPKPPEDLGYGTPVKTVGCTCTACEKYSEWPVAEKGKI